MANEIGLNLIKYGRILTDETFEETVAKEYFETRIRIFEMNKRLYYHKMVNGDIIECFELQ